MTTLEALAGAACLVGAFHAAIKFQPGKDSWIKLMLIIVLIGAGSALTVGQIALEASRQVEAQAR